MINFRYHLVSLIAVFLALAVGIVLGAGPLKGPVSDELGSQVSQLRERNDQLREEAAAAEANSKERDDYLSAGSEQLIGGLLPGHHVALLSVGDVPGAVRDNVRMRLEQAGASRAGELRLTDEWWKGSRAESLKKAADQLRGAITLPDAPDDDEAYLLLALTSALSGQPETSESPAAKDTKTTLQALRDAHLLSGTLDQHASGIVILYQPLATNPPAPTPSAEVMAEGEFGLRLAGSLAKGLAAVVAEGPATWSGEPVARIRADDDVKRLLSTVDNADELTGQLSVTRALAAQMNNVVGHYGTAGNAVGPLSGEVDQYSSLVPPYLKVDTPEPDNERGAGEASRDGVKRDSASAPRESGAARDSGR